MGAIVKSSDVRVTRTQYAVTAWGDGELWTSAEAVVAHDFRFDGVASSTTPSARGPLEDVEPPSGTLALPASRVGNDFVPDEQHAGGTERSADLRRRLRPPDPGSLVARFEAFLSGEPVAFDDVALDLEELTAFQRSVADVLQRVPRGEVVSYGELAALAGYPGAHRAAGSFCARNRFMFLLPCHRVVAADGIGGYGSSGVGVKRRLLELEGVRL